MNLDNFVVRPKRRLVEKYAKPLLRVLRQRGGHVKTEFVPGEGHVLSEAAMAVVRPKRFETFLSVTSAMGAYSSWRAVRTARPLDS